MFCCSCFSFVILLWSLIATFATILFGWQAVEVHEENERLKAHLKHRAKGNNSVGVYSMNSCSICLNETVAVIIQPCGHACLCKDCAKKLIENYAQRCPICRNKIRRIQNVYMSWKDVFVERKVTCDIYILAVAEIRGEAALILCYF